MKERIISMVLPMLVKSILAEFDQVAIKLKIDEWIDALENKIEASPSQLDDAFLPALYVVRELLNVPDND